MPERTARARFRFPTSLWAERNQYGELVEEDGKGASIREFQVRQANAFVRWIAERESGEWDPEGGFTVTHRVVDPHWLVRHVLQYGAEAQVLEPEEAREWVVEGVGGPVQNS